MTAIEGNISHGPIVSAVSDTSVKVWVRGDGVRNIVIEYRLVGGSTWTTTSTISTVVTNDYTAQWEITGLSTSTSYEFRSNNAAKTLPGNTRTFYTAPTPGEDATFNVAVFADVFSTGPAANAAASYSRMLPYAPAFVLQIGDWDHRDAGAGEPWTTPEMRWWLMHQQGMDATYAHGSAFRANVIGPANGRAYPLQVQLWDDHDYGWNNSDGNMERKENARNAHLDYFPRCEIPASDGIYQSFKWGQAEFFCLDVRSYRSPCTAIDDTNKTMLGADQLTWLKAGLLASTATWKIIVTPSAWNLTVGKEDAWATYQIEAQDLIDYISENGITGVVFVSGDMHSVGLLDDGTNAVLPEMAIPPTNTTGSGCTGGGCGTWSVSWSEMSPHAGLGVLQFTPDDLTLIIVGNDGTERRELVLTAA